MPRHGGAVGPVKGGEARPRARVGAGPRGLEAGVVVADGGAAPHDRHGVQLLVRHLHPRHRAARHGRGPVKRLVGKAGNNDCGLKANAMYNAKRNLR